MSLDPVASYLFRSWPDDPVYLDDAFSPDLLHGGVSDDTREHGSARGFSYGIQLPADGVPANDPFIQWPAGHLYLNGQAEALAIVHHTSEELGKVLRWLRLLWPGVAEDIGFDIPTDGTLPFAAFQASVHLLSFSPQPWSPLPGIRRVFRDGVELPYHNSNQWNALINSRVWPVEELDFRVFGDPPNRWYSVLPDFARSGMHACDRLIAELSRPDDSLSPQSRKTRKRTMSPEERALLHIINHPDPDSLTWRKLSNELGYSSTSWINAHPRVKQALAHLRKSKRTGRPPRGWVGDLGVEAEDRI